MPKARPKPRTPRRGGLEGTAYHEAGHAVAAYLRNRRFTAITIVPEGATLGRCEFSGGPTAIEFDAESYRRTRDRIETLIIVSLAGVVAESIITGRRNWLGAHADLHDASRYAAYVTGDETELGAYMNWLAERTRVLLSARPHWSAVKALASELLTSGTIGERRARQLIAEALSPKPKRRRAVSARKRRVRT